MTTESGLTVAVTGPTGTFGTALIPLLESDERVERVIGIARRPFDPAQRGWSKMEYRQGDVRDRDALEQAFAGADVVVHLAFLILAGNAETTRAINVDGTLNVFRAAADAGVRRFVYASSIAAFGFHPDNPVGMTEDWPTRPSEHFFYAQEKAELEHLLERETAKHPDTALYLLRPPIVLGPDAFGAKLSPRKEQITKQLVGLLRRAGVVPALAPDTPVQFIHQDDVAEALRLCVVAAGPPGAYNIAADDLLSGVDVARALGLRTLPIPGAPVRAAARAVSKLPFLPSGAQWVEALSHPAVMDTTRARTGLGWSPRHSARDSLRETLA